MINTKKIHFYIPATFFLKKILFTEAIKSRWYLRIHVSKDMQAFYRENKIGSKDILKF